MFIMGVARSFHHAAHGVQDTNGIGAPRFANVGCSGQSLRKARVTYGEILRTVIEAAIVGRAGGNSATGAFAFFENSDAVASLHQGASAGNARHAGSNDRKILNWFCLSVCFCHGATLHAMVGLEQCLFGSVLIQL